MEIKIGMNHIARELNLDIDKDGNELKREITEAIENHKILYLTDTRNTEIMVNAQNIAYVEFASQQTRRIGFAI